MNATQTDLAQIHAEIVAHLEAGGQVMVGTYTHATLYKKQHAGMFTMGKDGNLYVARGRSKDCLSCAGCLAVGIRFSRKNEDVMVTHTKAMDILAGEGKDFCEFEKMHGCKAEYKISDVKAFIGN